MVEEEEGGRGCGEGYKVMEENVVESEEEEEEEERDKEEKKRCSGW